MSVKEEIEGVIFPLYKNIIERIIRDRKNIFIKFISHSPNKKSKTRLKEGIPIYFYESYGTGKIIGMGLIRKIEYLTMEELIKNHLNNLMLTEQELRQYAEGRENKKILTIQLDNIIKYKKPVTVKVSINMGGQYITPTNKHEVLDIDMGEMRG